MLDVVSLLLSMWNESRHRNDSNRSGGSSPYSSAPLVRFLRRIEKIGHSNEEFDEDGEEKGQSMIPSYKTTWR
jgi:hypothetical protein